MVWAPDYLILAEAKNFKRLTDTVDDVELAVYISAASRAIDDACNRQFGKTAGIETRLYSAWYDDERARWIVDVDDFMSTVGLVVTIGGVTTTSFTKEPVNALQEGRPWEQLSIDPATATVIPVGAEYEVSVTVNPFGWSAFPAGVVLAAKLQVSRFAARRNSPYGIAGSPQDQIRLLARLDPDVAVALNGLRRPRKVG